MRRTPSLILAAMVLACPDGIRAQSFEPALWIRDATSAARNLGLDVADDGSVYMTGAAGMGSQWSDGTVFDPFLNDTFIARFNTGGDLLWIRSGLPIPSGVGWAYDDTAIYDVVAHGNAVFVNEGALWDAAPHHTRWPFFAGILVRMYSDSGDSLETVYLAGEPPGEGLYLDAPGFIEGLKGDAAGNLYLAGYFRDSLRLGPETLLVPPQRDHPRIHVFLASYAPNGEVRWARRMAGRNENAIAWWYVPKPSFEVDAAGNSYLGGYFTEGTVFGEGQPDSVHFGEDTAALVSYGADGRLRWVRTAQELGVKADPRSWGAIPNVITLPAPWLVAANEAGELGLLWRLSSDVGLSGGFGGRVEVTVGDTTFTETAPRKELMFVTRHAPDGRLQWVRRLNTVGHSSDVTEIAMDSKGHLYVGGAYFGSHIQLEGTVLLSGKDMDSLVPTGFAAHYDADGQLLETLNVTGPEATTTRVTGLVPTPSGELYVSGYAQNLKDAFPIVLAVGRDTLKTNISDWSKVFLAKYRPVSTAREPEYVRPVAGLQITHYPNPFLEAATLAYELPEALHVVLRVYDVLGRNVAVLVDEQKGAGSHSARVNASAWPSGVYLYRLEAGNQVATGRLVRRK